MHVCIVLSILKILRIYWAGLLGVQLGTESRQLVDNAGAGDSKYTQHRDMSGCHGNQPILFIDIMDLYKRNVTLKMEQYFQCDIENTEYIKPVM